MGCFKSKSECKWIFLWRAVFKPSVEELLSASSSSADNLSDSIIFRAPDPNNYVKGPCRKHVCQLTLSRETGATVFGRGYTLSYDNCCMNYLHWVSCTELNWWCWATVIKMCEKKAFLQTFNGAWLRKELLAELMNSNLNIILLCKDKDKMAKSEKWISILIPLNSKIALQRAVSRYWMCFVWLHNNPILLQCINGEAKTNKCFWILSLFCRICFSCFGPAGMPSKACSTWQEIE